MATESPTRIMSTSAASTIRADGASYAVTITSGVSACLWALTVGAVNLRGALGSVIASPPPSRARAAPGGTVRLPRRGSGGPGSAGVASAVELVALEVVPMAVEADLDDVAGELLVRRVEAFELGGGGDAAPVGAGERVAVDVGDEAEVPAAADRAVGGGGGADVAVGLAEVRGGGRSRGPFPPTGAPRPPDRLL